MKRQLPKNVRQIGNVSDSTKIYVEDYVDTFFNQLCDKTDQMPIGAFLIGEVVQEKEEEYIYVYGAVKMKEVGYKGKDIHIEERVWRRACEMCKEYFGNAEILGWFLTVPGQVVGVNHNLLKVHQHFFPRERSIFVMKDVVEKEEQYYVHKYHELMECHGHYVYYEKNEAMQNYMIASRKKVGFTPSEVVEDRITKDFRNVVKEKMGKENPKKTKGFGYVASLVLVVAVFGLGLTTMNKYGQLQQVQETIGSFVRNVTGEQVEEDTQVTDNSVIQLGDVLEENSSVDEPVTDEQNPNGAMEDDGQEAQEQSGETNPLENEEVTDDEETLGNVSGLDVYIVEKGDTLATISQKVYGDMSHIDEICQANGLEDGNLIFIGQKLLLP